MGDRVEEVVVAGVQARMHHCSGYSKHGSTSVLELNVELAITLISILDLSGEWVSSRDGSRRSIITSRKVLWSSGVLTGRHSNKLCQCSEEKDLEKSKGRDVAKSGESHTILENICEWVVSGKIKASRESYPKFLNSHTNEGSHGNTSMLDLDCTTTWEAVNIISVSERIKKIKRTRIDSKSIRGTSISVQGSGVSLVMAVVADILEVAV